MTNPDAGTGEGGGAATRLLLAFTGGDRNALDEMMPLVYDELHCLAEHYFGVESEDHTLQPTFPAQQLSVNGALLARGSSTPLAAPRPHD